MKVPAKNASTISAGVDLIIDAALTDSAQDRFEHRAIAKVVAELAVNAAPPVNVALFGPWGSGKSSFFGLLTERMTASGAPVKIARYDAWKYGGRALKKHFVGSIADQVGLGGEDFDARLARDRETLRLDLWAWFKTNWRSLFVGLVLAILITALWFGIVWAATWFVNRHGYQSAARGAITTIGTVLSLTFAALLIGPKILESAVVKINDRAPETDDEFTTSFQKLVRQAIDVGKGERLVVFIDELDRCSPEDVVATLIDLKTFLDVDGCIFIVAADREVLERALKAVPQANPVRSEDPYYSTAGAFLDKIFQHQIPLPPLRPQALTRFAQGLVDSQGGLWADLRDAEEDDRLFLRVVYALVPVHVRSPRRVKVLLNNYATSVRIAEARNIDWINRASEIACLTVLETEFPVVASDLVRIPRLLEYIRGEDCSSASRQIQKMVAGYRTTVDSDAKDDVSAEDDVAEPSGELLVDGADGRAQRDKANLALNAHLLTYLRKVAAQGIPDPRPDLFYLQSAGHDEGLTDPDLGYYIDFAAELAPADVVAAFEEQTSSTMAIGVRLLVQQSEAERGPGRSTIIESACRLAERLDREDLESIAPVVSGGVLSGLEQGDWRREATPGALLLGVVGTRSDLVERLLERQSAAELAADGMLSRVTPVLLLANAARAAIVHNLLSSAYLRYPDPLHDALRDLPIEPAASLWAAAASAVDDALIALDQPPVLPPTSRSTAPARATRPDAQTAAASSDEEAPSPDSAADRYAALLTAVESRNSDPEVLSSLVLEFGQRSTLQSVRAIVRKREDDILEVVADPERLNLHALLGMTNAPVGDSAWWAGFLSDAAANPEMVAGAFQRLVKEAPAADAGVREKMTQALTALGARLSPGATQPVIDAVQQVLSESTWGDSDGADLRDLLYEAVESIRHATDDGVADSVLLEDLLRGVEALEATPQVTSEVIRRIPSLRPNSAADMEQRLLERSGPALPVLRVRLALAASTGASVDAGAVLAATTDETDAATADAWFALTPSASDALQVVGARPVSRKALGDYAAQLSPEERTTLWIHCEGSGLDIATLRAVGGAGIGSAAVDQMAAKVSSATQLSEREKLVNRLVAARLQEQPPHRSATSLALSLLAGGIMGDGPLAARVAIASGGAAHGRMVELRSAFDAYVVRKNQRISKADRASLMQLRLLSAPRKTGFAAAIDTLLGARSGEFD